MVNFFTNLSCAFEKNVCSLATWFSVLVSMAIRFKFLTLESSSFSLQFLVTQTGKLKSCVEVSCLFSFDSSVGFCFLLLEAIISSRWMKLSCLSF